MARGKKVEQVLTLEEKLEQALVPEDEQQQKQIFRVCVQPIYKMN